MTTLPQFDSHRYSQKFIPRMNQPSGELPMTERTMSKDLPVDTLNADILSGKASLKPSQSKARAHASTAIIIDNLGNNTSMPTLESRATDMRNTLLDVLSQS